MSTELLNDITIMLDDFPNKVGVGPNGESVGEMRNKLIDYITDLESIEEYLKAARPKIKAIRAAFPYFILFSKREIDHLIDKIDGDKSELTLEILRKLYGTKQGSTRSNTEDTHT